MSEHIEQSVHDHPKVVSAIARTIFAIRWGLVPMYLLLWIPIVGYCLWFAQEVLSFWLELPPAWMAYLSSMGTVSMPQIAPIPHLLSHNRESFILWALGLIDASMVANLIVLIAMGSFKNFVYDFDFSQIRGMPKWFSHLDSNSLKIKMAISLIGVTAVAILRMAMEYNKEFGELIKDHHSDPTLVMHLMIANTMIQLVVHAAFIGTALGFTWNAKMMHSNHH